MMKVEPAAAWLRQTPQRSGCSAQSPARTRRGGRIRDSHRGQLPGDRSECYSCIERLLARRAADIPARCSERS